MFKKTSRRPQPRPLIETLENRTLLSAAPLAPARTAPPPDSRTSLTVSRHSAAFGQDINVTVSVKPLHQKGAAAGTVQVLENGSAVLQSDGTPLTLTLDAKGRASYRFGSGDLALFVGKQVLTAQYTSTNSLPASTSRAATVKVTVPKLKSASDGLQSGTVKKGKGKAVVKAGQTVSVLYTGLLAGSGQIFDYATANHGPGSQPFLSFPVEASPEQVIRGFDEGVVGMKVGETRVLVIPSALGYGSQANGPIPANSNLVFVVTLLSVA